MADGGIVYGEDYSFPRVQVRLFSAGETDPTHDVTFQLTNNPSRRLRDILPALTELQEKLHYQESKNG
jgi:hypothetical protein